LGSLSFTLAIMSRKQETLFYGVQQVVFFPLMLLSGVLLPMDTAPSWLYGLSRINPVTYIVDAERALFAGDLGLLSVLWGMLAALAIAGLGLLAGTRAMRNVSG
ncbi:MAG: ABC transporter permease, partial [Pseudonocardiaceae bacterium]